MEIKEWASLPTGGHLHCVTIMRHCRATSVFYLKHKTKRKRENETVKDEERDLMREHEEMERWLGSHCYWAKRWVALGDRNENISIPPSSPSFLSRPPFPCSHLLISSHPFPFLIIISQPSSFLHLSCIFNMYSSVNRSVMSQNCKLPHLPPSLFSPPLPHYLPLPCSLPIFSPPSPSLSSISSWSFSFLSRLLDSSTLTYLLPRLFGWQFSLGCVTFKKLLIKFCRSSH